MGDSQELVQAAMEAWVMAREVQLRLDGRPPEEARKQAVREVKEKFRSIRFGSLE